jgi:APA family basic amino acid/polyamine antiporter
VETIIGAGIYAILGAAAANAGTSLWISFLVASLVAVLTGFSYYELAALCPKAGAEYFYLKSSFRTTMAGIFIGIRSDYCRLCDCHHSRSSPDKLK